MIAETPNPSLVPFVIAETGHRDLRPQDLDELRDRVREVFTSAHKRMPSTPLVLLTGLAEGADQLVAEVALEQGVAVAAVLPMPIDVYRTTMSEPAAKTLDDLFARSAIQLVLPTPQGMPAELLHNPEAQAQCYEALALFLARHGQSLIALWDGKHSEKRGGTSRVVHYVRQGIASEGEEEIESRCGIVYQVLTPRLRDDQPARPIRTITLGCEPRRKPASAPKPSENPDNPAPVTFAQVEINIERFNREALSAPSRSSAPESKLIADPAQPRSPFQQRLEALYGRADAVSLHASGRRRFILLAILSTAVIGALFYGVHGEIFHQVVLLWLTFPFFVLVAGAIHWWARIKHVEENYLDSRALAEALRVQFFWDLAGIHRPVDRYYLMDRPSEVEWIRFALKNVWLMRNDRDENATPAPNCAAVLESWVQDQQAWYHEKANQQSHSVHQRERVSRDALIGAAVWAVVVPIGILIWQHLPHSSATHNHSSSEVDWYDAFHILLAVPALLAGAYRLWIEQAGYEEQSREYRYMEHQFALKAKELKANLNSPEITEKLLLELGMEALNENGRWLLLHRERPLEVLSTP
jgi:hypothetical protein